MNEFVHLHLHTEYSIKDGIVRIPALAEEVAHQQSAAVAVSDCDNLFAAVKFYTQAIEAGIKPIIGCELHLSADTMFPHHSEIVVLCSNEEGYRNLSRLVSKAYLDGQDSGVPLIHHSWLEQHNAGLLVLSGALRGSLGQALLANNEKQIDQLLEFWTGLFKDRYYIELQHTRRPHEKTYLSRALKLAQKTALPVVATNDVRFLCKEDFESHEVKVCISQGYTLRDKNRPRDYSTEQYLKTAQEMAALFGDIPSALQNSVEIARRCTVELQLNESQMPEFPIERGMTMKQKLLADAESGLQHYLQALPQAEHPQYTERLKHELGIICQMGYEGYFLIVADFIAWAKNNAIPVGPGRGSGAGSLVAYALGITEVDPLQYDLLFERFLNSERISLPDFDIDFCIEGRDRVIHYVVERYGRDKVSQIITFGSLGAKAVVRDVARVLGHPYGFADKLAKLIPFRLNIKLKEALAESAELKQLYQGEEAVKRTFDFALKLEGMARNPSTHAGGVVISPRPLIDYTALYCEPDQQNVVTHFDMKDIEKVGLVKFDFLGLKTLTIMTKAIANIRQHQGHVIVLKEIPRDDAKTYRLLQAANTTAIFQLESEGMRLLIEKLKPDSFEDIVALVALYRPGPLESGMDEEYAKRKHGQAFGYAHPKLEPLLRSTYGVILYQEQVMQIAQELAGYTLGAADILRRAMGKKISAEMAKQREVFISGAVEKGVEHRTASHIFDLMEKFAHYGFNKSHSVAYALIAYQAAWLKANYTGAFMAAVMTVDIKDTDKIVDLIDECRILGLHIDPPDINRSEYGFVEVKIGTILYGIGAVRQINLVALEAIVKERHSHGAYQSLADFCNRLAPTVKSSSVESLISAGAFDSIDPERSALLQALPDIYAFAEQKASDHKTGQANLFDEAPQSMLPRPSVAPEPIAKAQLSEKEFASLGFYLTQHPAAWCRKELDALVGHSLLQFRQMSNQVRITQVDNRKEQALVAGIITNVQRKRVKDDKGKYKIIAFFNLGDGSVRLNLRLSDKIYDKYADLLDYKGIAVVELYRINYNSNQKQGNSNRGWGRWLVSAMLTLDEARKRFAKSVNVVLNTPSMDTRSLSELQSSLQPYTKQADGCKVFISLYNTRAQTCLALPDQWRVEPCEEMIQRVKRIHGAEDVIVQYEAA